MKHHRTQRHRKASGGARLGQHFLTGTWAAHALAEAAGISSSDTVVEIGPGRGALTKELLRTGATIIAIEKDEQLVSELEHIFAAEISSGKLVLLSQDVRDFHPSFSNYVLAANIPYYITGEIIRQFLTAKKQPRTIALLVQKEVAQRIISATESILSLSVKAYGKPRIAAKVSKGNFSPPPSVDSAILVIDGISRTYFEGFDEAQFFNVVRAGFASKRKFLANNLSRFGKENVARAFGVCGLDAKVRAERVPLPVWKRLAQELSHA